MKSYNHMDFSLISSQTEASVSSHLLFPAEPYSDDRIDCLGDIAAKTLSEMVLNDQPAQDPRWGGSRGTDLGHTHMDYLLFSYIFVA